MTLTEFLLARIAEDETAESELQSRFHPTRVLAECEAKRRILTDDTLTYGERVNGEPSMVHWRIMSALALPYADHPDYRDEWRP